MNIGSPDGLRSFDPFRLADLEHRMWVAYYLRRWPRLLAASVRLLRLGFGTNVPRILQGAWLMLRAVQLWAPFPDNDPDGAQASSLPRGAGNGSVGPVGRGRRPTRQPAAPAGARRAGSCLRRTACRRPPRGTPMSGPSDGHEGILSQVIRCAEILRNHPFPGR